MGPRRHKQSIKYLTRPLSQRKLVAQLKRHPLSVAWHWGWWGLGWAWRFLGREANSIQALAALIGLVTILYGVYTYVQDAPQRRRVAHTAAWQLINSAQGQGASGGRLEAIQDLNNDGVSLERLVATNAFLSDIVLPNAALGGSNFQGSQLDRAQFPGANLGFANLSNTRLLAADLHGSNLHEANLGRADLSHTNLQNTDLSEAYLQEAQLEEADLKEADLLDAQLGDADLKKALLYSAKNITPEQIKQAKNWEQAFYDEAFRAMLGLPPTTPTPVR